MTLETQQEHVQTRRAPWDIDTDNPPPLELQQIDFILMELIFIVRHATSDQLYELFQLSGIENPRTGKPYKEDTIKRRIFRLKHHEYMGHMEKKQFRSLKGRLGRNLSSILHTGPQSARYLRSRGHDAEQIKGAIKTQTAEHIEHGIGVTGGHIAFKRALAANPDWHLRFVQHENEKINIRWTIRDAPMKALLKRQYYHLKTDEYFSIEGPDPRAQGSCSPMWFFKEFDNVSVSAERWRRRFASFTDFLLTNRHLKPPFNMMPIERMDGGKPIQPTFRKLIITTTAEHRDHLRQLAVEADPEKDPRKKKGLNIFWFTTEDQYNFDAKLEEQLQQESLERIRKQKPFSRAERKARKIQLQQWYQREWAGRFFEPIWYLPSGDTRYSLIQRSLSKSATA